jgi:hypothetical protein
MIIIVGDNSSVENNKRTRLARRRQKAEKEPKPP